MNELVKTAGTLVCLRACAPFVLPGLITVLIIDHWRVVLISGGGLFVVSFLWACWFVRHDEQRTRRYYAAERERLRCLGLEQKMKPLTIR
jgi:hypothetical protein